LPGPTRQFVATETLIMGTIGVAVKIGVDVRVTVGLRVGNSGVDVGRGVAVSRRPTGSPAIAVCVAPEIMVDITAVPRKLISSVGAGVAGKTQARETMIRTVTDKRMGGKFFILPPFGTRQS
jgi:hypothetical protein